MKKVNKIREVISEINRETAEQWELEAIEVNEKEGLNLFQRWLIVQNNMEARRSVVMEIQKTLRNQGYDVKINMQTYELGYYGKIK